MGPTQSGEASSSLGATGAAYCTGQCWPTLASILQAGLENVEYYFLSPMRSASSQFHKSPLIDHLIYGTNLYFGQQLKFVSRAYTFDQNKE